MFPKLGDNVAAPFMRIFVGAISRNPTVGHATTRILNSISVENVPSLTEKHEMGFV